MTLIVRSSASQRQLEESLRKFASSLSDDTPVAEFKPMPAILSDAVSAPRAVTSLFSAFAAVALVLASWASTRDLFLRRPAHPGIGVRMALVRGRVTFSSL